MKVDLPKVMTQIAGGSLLVIMAYYNDPEVGLVTLAALGGLIIGAAWADHKCAKLRGADAAIVAAAKKAAQAFMTPQDSCVPQLQELTKVLYLAGYLGK